LSDIAYEGPVIGRSFNTAFAGRVVKPLGRNSIYENAIISKKYFGLTEAADLIEIRTTRMLDGIGFTTQPAVNEPCILSKLRTAVKRLYVFKQISHLFS
jgi:hypothetical protein